LPWRIHNQQENMASPSILDGLDAFQFAYLHLSFIFFVFIVTISSFLHFLRTWISDKICNYILTESKVQQPTDCAGRSGMCDTVAARAEPLLRNPHLILTELIKLALAAETCQGTNTSCTSEQLREWSDCLWAARLGSVPGRAETFHRHQPPTQYTSGALYSHKCTYTCRGAKLPPPHHSWCIECIHLFLYVLYMRVSEMLRHWGKFMSDFRRGIEDILEETPKTKQGFITKKPLHRKWFYRQKTTSPNRFISTAIKLTKIQFSFHSMTFYQLHVVERQIGKRL
jgi:hypothetical protein